MCFWGERKMGLGQGARGFMGRDQGKGRRHAIFPRPFPWVRAHLNQTPIFSYIKNLLVFWQHSIKTGNRIDQWQNAKYSTGSRVLYFRHALIWCHLTLRSLCKIGLIETFRFRDENEYEDNISSILNKVRAWSSVIWAGKRDSRRHSTTDFSSNVVMTETS